MQDGVPEVSFRESFAQIVATLTRILGPRHVALAEEAAQDALVKALQTWPHEGTPANPSAWLIQVAKHRAIDRIRREQRFEDGTAPPDVAVVPVLDATLRGETAQLGDDELAMMFLACHPRLPREARVALTLKVVCGFSVPEIARALLSRDEAIAQRLVRAKRQLRDDDVRFVLEPGEYVERTDSVLDVLYLLFNEGYAAHAGEDLIRHELCGEAIRLARLLAAHPMLSTPVVHALLALMLLQAARFPARIVDADFHRLAEQDRGQWDPALIAEGLTHLDRAADGDRLSTYHLEAGIAACHAVAVRYEDTDWPRIVEYYDDLLRLKPTPVVALNRAIAISRLEGPAAGTAALEAIVDDPALSRYYLLHATLGQFALDAGDPERAAECFGQALGCECSDPERRFLERQLARSRRAGV
jgi:RNA polymerase sigma-70 factor, ECF subfamily